MMRSTEPSERPMVVRGSLITMDPARPRAEAMAVVDGRIAAVGGLDEARAAAGSSAAVLDLGGATVLPGLVDSHNHMLWTGLATQLVDLSSARSVADVVQAVRVWAGEHPEVEWVVGAEGCEVEDLAERRYPTRQELDEACRDRPVYLPRAGHAAATNTVALARGGVRADTPDPAGGVVERDERGEPTGLLLEVARELVGRRVPPLTPVQRAAALKAVQPRYLASGITTLQEPGLRPAELAGYQQLWADGDLLMRVTAMPLVADGTALAERLDGLRAIGVRTGFGDQHLRLGGLKLFLDGGGSLGTALLRSHWPGRPGYHGELVTSAADLETIVRFCAEERWSLGVHAVGGAAMDLALSAFDAAQRSGGAISDLRFSLIHAYLDPSPENMATARRLGVVVAAQPTMQERFAGVLERRLGREHAARATPLRTWIDAGVTVAGGSDSPVTPHEPFRGIWQAVTRFSGEHGGVLGPEERISRSQALEMYTTNAAWCSFAEDTAGALRPGMPADWLAVPLDPLTCPEDDIAALEPLITAVDGEIVHDRRPAPFGG